MEQNHLHLSLLDYLGYRVECPCLSDLRLPSVRLRTRLLEAVEELAPEEAPVQEWNETLLYLRVQKDPAPSAAQARDALLAWLRGSGN